MKKRVRRSKGMLKEQRNGGDWDGMSEKHQRFCMAYLATMNPRRAAEIAGFKPNSATALLKNEKVNRWLGKVKRKFFEDQEVHVDQLIKRVNQGLHRDIADLLDNDGMIHGDLRKVPLRMRHQIDSIEQDVRVLYDSDGNETGRQVKSKLRLTPSASILDIALKMSGLLETLKAKADGETVNVPWDELLPTNDPVDELSENDDGTIDKRAILEQMEADEL